MRIVCPTCNAMYRLPEDKIPATKSAATCKRCGGRIEFDPNPTSRQDQPPPEPQELPQTPLRPAITPEPRYSSPPCNAFSLGDAIRFGWETLKGSPGFFILFMLVMILIPAIPELLSRLADQGSPALRGLFTIVSYVFNSILTMGFIRVALKTHDGEKPGFEDLFSCTPLLFKYFFSSLLYGLTVLAGFILLVLPGILWAIQFGLYLYAIVDRGDGPVEALQRSSRITKGARLHLFLLGLVLVGINILGMLALGIGLFLTVPLSFLAYAHAYRQLQPRVEPQGSRDALRPVVSDLSALQPR